MDRAVHSQSSPPEHFYLVDKHTIFSQIDCVQKVIRCVVPTANPKTLRSKILVRPRTVR
jgi:hypothetical protein